MNKAIEVDMRDESLPLSVAAWSLHRSFEAGELDQIGMVRVAAELGFRGFEAVNTFFPVRPGVRAMPTRTAEPAAPRRGPLGGLPPER